MLEANRYIRQTSLEGFGVKSQQKLKKARVLVVGAGGLGVPVLQYLTAMGVGTIGIVENDVVSLANLQRQVIYSESDVGNPKIHSVILKLKDLNGDVKFLPFKTFLHRENALNIIDQFDLVVDASDNFPTRYLINDACVILNKPFVYGALHSFEGQVSVFNFKDGPTYRCLFPNEPSSEEIPNCNENGVLGVIPGIIGSLQALEAVKVLTGIGEVLSGSLLLCDGLYQEFQKMKFILNPNNLNITELNQDYGFDTCDFQSSISAQEFSEILQTRTKLKILDVRTPTEFKSGHLSQAMNLPFISNEIKLSTNGIILDKEWTNYILCQYGKRSIKALSLLKSQFPSCKFIHVEGGYSALDQNLLSDKYKMIGNDIF